MTASALPLGAAASPRTAAGSRDRWRMGPEAKALVIVTATLLAFGLATLYSASAYTAMANGGSSMKFLLKQVTGAVAGVVAFMVFAKVDAERWKGWAWPLMAVAIALMLLTVLPFTKSIAPAINGSRRFLLGGSLQPSELAKLAVIVWSAMLVVRKGPDGLHHLGKGLLPFFAVVGVLCLLAALEPDLSTALFYVVILGTILFTAGARIGHFVFLGLCGIPVLASEVQRLDYVMARLLGFADAGANVQVNDQLRQSLIAVGSGGFWGVGFGQGRQAYGFLPLPYNDFIAGNIGEEWGFVGLTVLVLLYALWGYLGFRIAQQARSEFTRLVAVGLTVTMIITAYLHIGVAIGLLPTTGLTLPFISYGRSNLMLSLLMTGILVNIGSARERLHGSAATNPTPPTR